MDLAPLKQVKVGQAGLAAGSYSEPKAERGTLCCCASV